MCSTFIVARSIALADRTAFETSACSRPRSWDTFGIVKNHPFVDGNKRTALIAGSVFFKINGGMRRWTKTPSGEVAETHRLDADKWEAIVLGVIAGTVSRDQLAQHFADENGGDWGRFDAADA